MELAKILLLALVCVGIGYILKSLLDALIGGDRSGVNDSPSSPAEGEKPVAPPPLAEAVQPPAAPVHGVLVRRDAAEAAVIEMDGQPLASAKSLTEAQRSRLCQAADDLNAWLGRPAVLPPAPAPVAAPPPETAPALAVNQAHPAPLPPPPPSSSPSLIPAPLPGTDVPQKPPRIGLNPVNILANALKADAPKLPERSLSLVAQVNDILQEKIRGTTLMQRGLMLTESLDHGMLVIIGMEKYDGIDAVPDDEIRTLIRQCVAEWSSRMAR